VTFKKQKDGPSLLWLRATPASVPTMDAAHTSNPSFRMTDRFDLTVVPCMVRVLLAHLRSEDRIARSKGYVSHTPVTDCKSFQASDGSAARLASSPVLGEPHPPASVEYLALALTAAGFALVVTPPIGALARRLGAVDMPGPRRVHAHPVPRLGGVALLLAGLAALYLSPLLGIRALDPLRARGWHLGWLLGGALVTVAAGAIDDVRGLPPLPKLGLQILAAGVALAGGYGLRGVTNPFGGGYVEFGALGALLTLAWIVTITNAFNLIDGLDGLAAGVALIASATLFAVSLAEGRTDAACLWATLGGTLVGFLCYNFNPASIFLGDSGSLLLGYLLGVLSIQSLQKGATAVIVLVPILALGLPLMEVVLTLLRRTFFSGVASIFHADREHIHHRLMGQGMTHRRAVLTLYAVCVAFSVLSFVAVAVQGMGNAVVVGVAGVAMYAGIRALGYRAPRRETET
jgi:UDP-GlcNAc:undecaprenyl-phosphate/decaprenyl-phosphate GlcNAc-1-phosphate transferase